jgi:nitroreductase/NAD-dependent dihydropyrimidine dehydrogenase PreA subunit
MALFEVEKDTCTKCGACAAVCPGGIIDFPKDEFPHLIPKGEAFCIRCGHCVAVCPTQSVMHRECPVDQCPKIEKALNINFKHGAQLIKGRRSIRVYQDKPVSREIIAQLIDTARYGPTGGNSQGVQWLVFDNKDQMKRFSEIGLEWMRAASKMNTPTTAKLANMIKYHEAGRDGFLRGAPVLVLALGEKSNPAVVNSCTIALSYFDLAASSMGLGCMWAGFFMFASSSFPSMLKELALPEGLQSCGAMTLGYPKYQCQRIPVRKPARIIWRP